MSIIYLAIILVLLILPNWLLLVTIPLLMVLSMTSTIPPLISIGDVDIQIYDIVLIMMGFKVVTNLLYKRQIPNHPVYSAIVVWLVILFLTTLTAFYRFGKEIFIAEIIALLRLIAQISILFLIPQLIQTSNQINIVRKSLEYMGYACAIIIYLNVILLPKGFVLGEVQATKEIIRYFGPLGDQVGFIILFFIYSQLISCNFLKTLFFWGAIVATGTVGILIAFGVGLIVLVIHTQKGGWRINKHRFLLLLIVIFIMSGILFWIDFGGLKSRLTGGSLFNFTIVTRQLTMGLATRVFLDNPFIGVGYTGFRFVALDYGAKEAFFEKIGGFSPSYIATAYNQYLQLATDGGILALASFLWMALAFLKTLKSSLNHVTGEIQNFLQTGYIWLLSLLIGAQSACWLLPGSLISYLLWIILGLALVAGRRGLSLEDNEKDQDGRLMVLLGGRLRKIPKFSYRL